MRIRTIKPEFYLHEGLYELEAETLLPIRIAFTGLWCVADREGRFKWEPRKIGVQVMPYDPIDFSRVLDALTTRGFVRKYIVDSVEYGCIPSFSRHQVINNRERESELPQPTDCNICDASTTREARVATRDQSCKEEGKGKEGNREGIPPNPQGGILPDGWKKLTKTEQGRKKVNFNNHLMIRLGKLFGQKETTLWTIAEYLALQDVNPPEDEISLIEAHYSLVIENNGYRITSLITLLNNWTKARNKADAYFQEFPDHRNA